MKPSETVTNYMTPVEKLITFTPDTDIKDAIIAIIDNKISGAPVLNEKKELIGMLSEKDCLRLIVSGNYYDMPSGKGKVVDYMTREVKTISSNCTIIEIAYEFIHTNYRRFPVVDNGKLLGQISRRDVLMVVK